MEKSCIVINGNEISYYLIKKKMKNVNIRIKPDGNIYLSCPIKMKKDVAEKFLIDKYNWIIKHQNRINEYSTEKEMFEENGKVYFLGKIYKLHIISSKSNDIKIDNESINIYIKEKYAENKNYIQKYYEKYLKEECYKTCEFLIKKYRKELPEIEIKKLKTRWGSCSPYQNKVTFNLSLIKTPIECIEYVVIHELSHFKEQNHSKKFYNIVESYISDWKLRRKLLNNKYNIVI